MKIYSLVSYFVKHFQSIDEVYC